MNSQQIDRQSQVMQQIHGYLFDGLYDFAGCELTKPLKILQIGKKCILLQSQRGIRRRDDNPYR